MSEGSKPDVFHSDDMRSEYLDSPGKPVGKLSLFQIYCVSLIVCCWKDQYLLIMGASLF